jgi:cellulose synthase/poly-beta-1,6-N-acetylglucosamine synthase-like glycosyltransferase
MTSIWLNGAPSLSAIAQFLFWATAGVLFYTYAGYPLLLAVIGAFAPKKQAQPGYLPQLSILIAAYNEEANIGRKLEQTLALDYPADKMEILVLSDGSTDRTDEIVHSFTDPRVRLLRMEPRRGKTSAQNRGVQQARGEVLVFSDATTVYHPQALRFLACNYENPGVGAERPLSVFRSPRQLADRAWHDRLLELREFHQDDAVAHPNDQRLLRLHLFGAQERLHGSPG